MNQLAFLAAEVMAVYHDIDRAVAVFQRGTHLACPEFCGRCCDSGKVEATLLECLPLAFALFEAGLGEAALDEIENLPPGEKRCFFYDGQPEPRTSWACRRYETRPLICRMFGFAGNHDRLGKPRLALCRVMKSALSLGDGDAYRLAGDSMPVFHEAALRLAALHPEYGVRMLPINLAFRQALLKVGALRYLVSMKE
jgi:Fe-S-cluster containining protein